MVKLSAGEHTIRQKLIKSLDKCLTPLNLIPLDEVIINLPGDRTIEIPDIIIVEKEGFTESELDNGQISIHIQTGALKAVIETKHPKKFASDGIAQLLGYMSELSSSLGFATNFKTIFRIKTEKKQLISKFQASNIGLASRYICTEIETPTIEDQKSEDLVSLLQTLMEETQAVITTQGITANLKETLGIFEISSDKSVLTKIKSEDIEKAASFLLLNQIMFYVALTKTVGFPEIETIKSLIELQNAFDYVLLSDYKAVFSLRVIQGLNKEALTHVQSLLSIFNNIQIHQFGGDLLGKIFHEAFPFNLRKQIAAFYTSDKAAELLAELSITNSQDKVIDLACGSGTLLVKAYHVKKRLSAEQKKPISHQKLLNSIIGVDISLFAAHLAVINLSMQDLDSRTDLVKIAVEDAFNTLPSSSKIVLFGAPPPDKQATLDGTVETQFEIFDPDLIIFNPPFTRIERLPKVYLTQLKKETPLRNWVSIIKGQFGLHCLFLLHSSNFLKAGKKLAAVLPAATFSSNYSKDIEKFMVQNFFIDYIILSKKDQVFSEGSTLKEILLIASRKSSKDAEVSSSHPNAKIVILQKSFDHYNIRQLSGFLKKIEETNLSPDLDFVVYPVTQKELSEETNWLIFSRYELIWFISLLKQSNRITKQKNIIKFHTGYHLDAAYFFRIPNPFWEIVSAKSLFVTIRWIGNGKTDFLPEKRTLKISSKFLKPSLGRPHEHQEINSEPKVYLLAISEEHVKQNLLNNDTKLYIRWGEILENETISPKGKKTQTALELYKIRNYCSRGFNWFTYGSYIIKKKGGFIGGKLSLIEKLRLGVRNTLALYSESNLTGPTSFVFGNAIQKSNSNDKILGAWFCSSIFLAIYIVKRRIIHGEFGRVTAGDLMNFPCLVPENLDKTQIEDICNAFDNYRSNQPHKSMINQVRDRNPYLLELDKKILNALDLEKLILESNIFKTIDGIQERVYSSIIQWAEQFIKRKDTNE